MLKYPLSTLLYIAKINIKDTIKDALKLHNNIDVSLTVIVKDKDGKMIKQHKQHSHSFVMNFLALISNALMNPYNSYSNLYYYIATNGGWYSDAGSDTTFGQFLNMLDGANDSTYGIVVGTGTATPTPNDYALRNQIQNGTGTGQLVYSAHTVNPPPASSYINNSSQPSTGVLNVSGNTTSIQISRQFSNQSGASITASEVGIIVETDSYAVVSGSAYYTPTFVLIVHDLLSSPITIPNNAVLTIVYTISVST